MHIPILTGVQKGHICGSKNGHKLLKNVFLKLNFLHERHLYANCFLYIVNIHCEFRVFQFLDDC